MNAIIPHLAKAAAYGAAFGIGMEFLQDSDAPKGIWLTASVVAAVAAGALSYYVGAAAAVGFLIGTLVTFRHVDSEIFQMLGGGICGTTVGYLAGRLFG